MLSGSPVVASGEQLLDRFVAASARQRRTLLPQVLQRSHELVSLIPAQLERLDCDGDDWAAGTLVQLWLAGADAAALQQWSTTHPQGWLRVDSAVGIAYEAAERRGYVYYSEVPPMPALDLQSLDRLWVTYSQGRYGFSVQLRLLRSCNQRWDQLWPRIGWKQSGIWTRYPPGPWRPLKATCR